MPLISDSIDALPAYVAAAAPNTLRDPAGHPPNPPGSTFELLVTVTVPPKRAQSGGKKAKAPKPDLLNFGPVDVSDAIEWDQFLDVIAKLLKTTPTCLLVSSFEWHWLKPASSPWLLLQSSAGLASMLKKVKGKADAYVILRTKAPKRDRLSSTLPWNPGTPSYGVDDDEGSDHEARTPKRVSR